MTYKEKFKELFGYFPESCTNDDAICDFVDCEAIPCVSCKYLREDGTHVKWGDEITTNPRLQSFEIPVLKKVVKAEFHCGFEESGGHAYNCNDCPNKCEEWYQWDKEGKDRNTCIDCEHFSDKEYYADNSIFVSAVSFGSCTKCQRNITLTSPNTEAPDWCPIKKGDEDARNA